MDNDEDHAWYYILQVYLVYGIRGQGSGSNEIKVCESWMRLWLLALTDLITHLTV